MIDLFYPYIPKEEYVEAFKEVIYSRFVGQGPKVDQFEKDFKKLFYVPHAVSVNSGTAALATAYDLVGIEAGDEVISTPLTCAATNLEILSRGAKIIWADILRDTLCIDPADVRRKVTDKTKAVVQVHLGGIQANVGEVYKDGDGIPERVPVISDAAQALGIFNGDYTCCSFQAIKQITTFDGGMLVCNNESDAHRAKLLRWFGIDRDIKIANNWQAYRCRKMTFDIEELGTKRHMHDVSAAMGIVALKHYYEVVAHARSLFCLYASHLTNVPGIKIIDGNSNTCWLFTILVDRRDDFAKMLFEADVDTNVVQVRNDIYKIFGGVRADLPVMNEIEEQYISLPIGMHITEDHVEYICNCIKGGW